jgi:hypothetical protein
MAYVRLARAFPYTAFPAQEFALPSTCTTAIGFDLEVGALRCVPVHEDGSGLEPAETLDMALTTTADMAALHHAIACCFDPPILLLTEWAPLGPQGGCVGGAWTFQVGMV